jgi:hypothetical protein
MNNIAFHYFYRDGANYKNFNTLIFENNINITLVELNKLIKSKLIEEEYFHVTDWNILDLHFGNWDDEFDHDFHTFDSINFTSEHSNTTQRLSEFINNIELKKSI